MPTKEGQDQPGRPKIYHILHHENLPSVIAQNCLWSDAQMIQRGLLPTNIGMSSIKERRLTSCEVACHPGTKVGEYVPFYFCPRSVMLYLLHQGNHPELTYRGGQQPIVHLEADLFETVEWAENVTRRWAFTTCNASAGYATFYAAHEDLNRINWTAIQTNQWRDPVMKEGKQAEFLLYEWFPWSLVRRIGVYSEAIATLVKTRLTKAGALHVPTVEVLPQWYY